MPGNEAVVDLPERQAKWAWLILIIHPLAEPGKVAGRR